MWWGIDGEACEGLLQDLKGAGYGTLERQRWS